MKKTICLFLFITAVMLNANAAGSPKMIPVLPKPSATIQKMWVDYDQTMHDDYGMIIHINFTAYDMQDVDALLAIYFHYNDASGYGLKDKNNRYNTPTGQVA